MDPSPQDTAAFEALYRDLAPRVFAYALRHSSDSVAQDIVSDTFLVAWRRRADLPGEPLPWLLVVARNTLANRRRRDANHERLPAAMAQLGRVAAPAADHEPLERQAVLDALAQLSALEREALLLVAWDGLSSHQAASVAGCSPRAFEVRLSRARARLARAMSARDTAVPLAVRPRRATS